MANYPLKDNFRRNMPVRLIPSPWLNWVSNFFNTANWIGFDVTWTNSGKDIEIKTVGFTGSIEVFEGSLYADAIEITFVNGLITLIEVVP